MDFPKQRIVLGLQQGGVGILPTDTIYGLVGRALSKKAVEKIYKLKKRNPRKSFIILINSLDDLRLFGIKLDRKTRRFLRGLWPAKISVILPCRGEKFRYLHRGAHSLAFRLPKKKWLRELLKKTGPLVAPSANPEGKKPAATLKEAKDYFGNGVDFYLGGGRLKSKPSTIIRLDKNQIEVIRKGMGYPPNGSYKSYWSYKSYR